MRYLFAIFFTMDDTLVNWESDHICQFKENQFSKDFRTSTFNTDILQMVYNIILTVRAGRPHLTAISLITDSMVNIASTIQKVLIGLVAGIFVEQFFTIAKMFSISYTFSRWNMICPKALNK